MACIMHYGTEVPIMSGAADNKIKDDKNEGNGNDGSREQLTVLEFKSAKQNIFIGKHYLKVTARI